MRGKPDFPLAVGLCRLFVGEGPERQRSGDRTKRGLVDGNADDGGLGAALSFDDQRLCYPSAYPD